MQLQTIKNLCCSTCLVFLSCLYANLGIRYFIKDVQYKSVAASLFLYCQIYSTASEFYGYYASSWHHPFAIWDSYFTNSAIRMLNYLVFNELLVFCFWLIQIKFLIVTKCLFISEVPISICFSLTICMLDKDLTSLDWSFPEFGRGEGQLGYHPAWLGSTKDGAARWGCVEAAVEEMMRTSRLSITACRNFCCSLLVDLKVYVFPIVLFMIITGYVTLRNRRRSREHGCFGTIVENM